MDATDVLAVAEQSAQFSAPAVAADWAAPIPDMEWSVAQGIAHAAEAPLWYAFDLTAGGADLTTLELRVTPEHAPATLVAALVTAARVLAPVLAFSSPDARGIHPWGQADPSGYAAMACDELLIHTDDAGLCARVLARLFPKAPVDLAPWDGPRWANGRDRAVRVATPRGLAPDVRAAPAILKSDDVAAGARGIKPRPSVYSSGLSRPTPHPR